jgi:enoyl-CoA hydratase/carnithine racemase
MEQKVTTYEIADQIGTITLARPKRRNAWTGRMHQEYRWILYQADADPNVRVVIVTGAPEGQAFCAGADLAALEGHAERGSYDAGVTAEIARPGYGVHPHFDATFAYHFGLEKPVIAAINGPAAGVGMVIAAYADLRFASSTAKFTAAHGRFNFPAELGLSWLLPRIVGLTHANDILLSSRTFSADEAMAMGFLNAVLPPDRLMDHVRDYAARLVRTTSPGSTRETKRQIYLDLHRDAASAVGYSEQRLEAMITEPNYAEGVRAWVEKRAPNWRP